MFNHKAEIFSCTVVCWLVGSKIFKRKTLCDYVFCDLVTWKVRPIFFRNFKNENNIQYFVFLDVFWGWRSTHRLYVMLKWSYKGSVCVYFKCHGELSRKTNAFLRKRNEQTVKQRNKIIVFTICSEPVIRIFLVLPLNSLTKRTWNYCNTFMFKLSIFFWQIKMCVPKWKKHKNTSFFSVWPHNTQYDVTYFHYSLVV